MDLDPEPMPSGFRMAYTNSYCGAFILQISCDMVIPSVVSCIAR